MIVGGLKFDGSIPMITSLHKDKVIDKEVLSEIYFALKDHYRPITNENINKKFFMKVDNKYDKRETVLVFNLIKEHYDLLLKSPKLKYLEIFH